MHLAARLDPVVISTTNAVGCRCAASRPIREILNAQGWAGQTLTTSSTMVVDLRAGGPSLWELVAARFPAKEWSMTIMRGLP